MKKKLLLGLVLLCGAFASSFAQESTITKGTMAQAEVDRIVKKVTENEGDFRYALTNYVFNRSATIQTLGMGGQVTGQYRRDSFMTFSENGGRFERIVFFPISTLKEISVTAEDLEDLGGVNPFALEPKSASLYNFTYLGKERIDELNLYVFDVAPKVMPVFKKGGGVRLFLGRVWVDDADLMIVKSKGKGVPEGKDDKYPVVETWRENVDGKFWFPSYSSSDDELVFSSGNVVKMRIRIKYTDYRQGRSDVKIIDDGAEEEKKPAPSPSPTKP